jgi:hypothetical protein
MSARLKLIGLFFIAALVAGSCLAQGRRGGRGGFGGFGGWGMDNGPLISTEGGIVVNEDTVRTARETRPHSTESQNWTNPPGFERDVFTFTRVIYKQNTSQGSRPTPGPLRWVNDYPDSDLDLSFRLQQITSMKVDPDGRVLKLTDPTQFFVNLSSSRPDYRQVKLSDLAVFDYPFIYVVKPGGMELRNEEVPVLRQYLLNGGVLMADDFWGDSQWNVFEAQIKRALPERRWQELPLNHPIFHCVFPLNVPDIDKVQVPSIHRWERGQDTGFYGGWAAFRGDGDPHMHLRTWLDDKGRIMVIATHNSDNGDGWEREGENPEYFRLFSETRAYPLGINIVFYVMTH